MATLFLDDKKTRLALSQFVLKASTLEYGEHCAQFEREFARFAGRKQGVLFSSGTAAQWALFQALRRLGLLERGSTIGYSALTSHPLLLEQQDFHGTAIEGMPATVNIMSEDISAVHRTTPLNALLVTHALGFTGDIDEISRFCENHGIICLENISESLGTTLVSGSRLGSFGLASVCSLSLGQPLTALDGGIVTTDHAPLLQALREVREWGLRPTEIVGYLGSNQLNLLPDSIEEREKSFLAIERVALQNPNFVHTERAHLGKLAPLGFPVVFHSTAKVESYQKPLTQANVKTISFPTSGKIHGFYIPLLPGLKRDEIQVVKDTLKFRAQLRKAA